MNFLMMQGQGYEGQTLMLPAYSAPDLFQLDGKPLEQRRGKGLIPCKGGYDTVGLLPVELERLKGLVVGVDEPEMFYTMLCIGLHLCNTVFLYGVGGEDLDDKVRRSVDVFFCNKKNFEPF